MESQLQLIKGISSNEFRKGMPYVRKVRIFENSFDYLRAEVQGSYSYPYEIVLQKNTPSMKIKGTCDCPAFYKNDQCKHIAAVITSQKGTFFKKWSSYFEFEPLDGDFEEDSFEYDDSYEMERIDQVETSRPNIDFYLDILSDKIKEKEDSSKELDFFYYSGKARQDANLPHEIWYGIDIQYSYDQYEVEIFLQCKSMLKSGRLGKSKNVNITRELIERLPLPDDKLILKELTPFGQWDYSLYKGFAKFSNASFPLEGNELLLRKILQTGRGFKKKNYYYSNYDDTEIYSCSDSPARMELEVDSKSRQIEPILILDDKRPKLDQVDIYSRAVSCNNVFYFFDENPHISQTLIRFLGECSGISLTEGNWNKLKTILVNSVDHSLFTGDRFGMEIQNITPEIEVHVKWDGQTHLIEGFIHSHVERNCESLYSIDNSRFEMMKEQLTAKVKSFKNNEKHFSFAAPELFPLIETLKALDINVLMRKQKIKSAGKFDIKVNSGIDWLELKSKMTFDESEYDLQDFLRKIKIKDNLVELGDGSLGVIPSSWIQKIKNLQRHVVTENKKTLLHPAKALVLEDIDHSFENTQVLDIAKSLKSFTKIKEKTESKKFKGELRKYQRFSLGWFDFLERCNFGGCLADDMGLGKTIQVIAHLQKKFLNDSNLKALIVSPKSLTGNWQREFSQFAPEIKTFKWESKSLNYNDFKKYQVFFVSYPLLQRQADLDFSFDYLILDEAQNVKNAKSLTHKKVKTIKARYKFALTGTPVENHLGEMMNIFNVVIPGLFSHKNIENTSNLDELEFIRPFLLRRTKEEVLQDLPKKTIQTIYCEQEASERQIYLKFHRALKLELESETKVAGQNKFNMLQILTKLRQASCHISLLDSSFNKKSGKIETLKELVEEILSNDEKVIIFSQFTRFLNLLRKELDFGDHNSCYLDGKTRNRDAVIDEFKKSPEKPAFFISLKAGGFGLNLTNASYCIIVDPWWNPAVEAQAIDRIHRIGQTKPVFAYRLIMKNTIEEKVNELQEMKRELYKRVLDNSSEGFIKNLESEDIKYLLS